MDLRGAFSYYNVESPVSYASKDTTEPYIGISHGISVHLITMHRSDTGLVEASSSMQWNDYLFYVVLYKRWGLQSSKNPIEFTSHCIYRHRKIRALSETTNDVDLNISS